MLGVLEVQPARKKKQAREENRAVFNILFVIIKLNQLCLKKKYNENLFLSFPVKDGPDLCFESLF